MKNSALLVLVLMALLFSCNANSSGNTGGSEAVSEKLATKTDNPEFNADSAYRFVAEQVAFGPRNPGSKGHSECAEYLVSKLRQVGADTVITHTPVIDIPYAGKTGITNILARFNSSSPRRIMLLAHWDTRPVADEDPDPELRDKPIPGANDGGSGVGVLLETARILGAVKPGIGVDILFVDAEDSGIPEDDDSWCLGTQEWLKTYPNGVPGAYAPEFAVLLDMVGGKDAVFHREMFSDHFAPQIVNRVWGAAEASGNSKFFSNKRGGAINDDHIALNKGGIPAIDIIESNNSRTGGFNPTWHTHSDNMDNISGETLKAVGETVVQLIYSQK